MNTYVKPIFDFFGKSGEYNAIKDKLWPNYEQIEGIEASDKAFWGTQRLALKTFEFEQENEAEYNRLYDSNLSIIRDELINLFNNNFTIQQGFMAEQGWKKAATPKTFCDATFLCAVQGSAAKQECIIE